MLKMRKMQTQQQNYVQVEHETESSPLFSDHANVASSPSIQSSHKFTFIEAGRAVAAIMVVLYHVDKYYFGAGQAFSRKAFGGIFQAGHAGVEFFFVLSGFIIAMVHHQDFDKPSSLPIFATKRFLRIFPFYWICLFAVIVLSNTVSASHVSDRMNGTKSIIGSIFLTGIGPTEAVIFVSWTLFHEVLFYFIFSALIYSRRAGTGIIALWLLLCSFNSLFGGPYPFAFINILFGIGMLTWCASPLIIDCYGLKITLALVGIVGFCTTGFDEVYSHLLTYDVRVFFYGICSAMALGGLTTLEAGGFKGAPTLLLICGQASYSIYLTHSYIAAPIVRVLSRFKAEAYIPAEMLLTLLVTLAILIGIAIHYLIERPAIRFARRILQSNL